MKCLSRFVCGCLFAQRLLLLTSPCFAEEQDPRRWAHLPINTNFYGSAYAYTEADIGFYTVLKIEGAEMELHTWVEKYIRTFSLFTKTERIGILQAYQVGSVSYSRGDSSPDPLIWTLFLHFLYNSLNVKFNSLRTDLAECDDICMKWTLIYGDLFRFYSVHILQ